MNPLSRHNPTPPAIRSNRFWRALPGGMRRRWWWFRPFDLLARYWPIGRTRRGLVVVRMDGIGDMVLFRNALDQYAGAFAVDPHDITVIGCHSWGALAPELFRGYRVVAIDEHAYAKKPFYRFAINLKVRHLAPETVVSDSYFRRALMADSLVWMMAPARSVVSYPYINAPTRSEFTYYMSTVDQVIDTGPYPTHELIRHARFIEQVSGIRTPLQTPRLNWPDHVAPFDIARPYAVLNPGSNEYGRRWPIGKYLELAQWIRDRGLAVVFVGKADERADGAAVAALADGRTIIDLTGKTGIADLLDLMKQAALVVSNDTGPAHLAIGLGVATVVIIGGGHFGSFVPYPAAVTPSNVRFVYEKMACYHCFWRCHKRDDKFASFPCISNIGSAAVQTACRGVYPPLADRYDGDA